MKNFTNKFTGLLLFVFFAMSTNLIFGNVSADKLITPNIRLGIARIEGHIANYIPKAKDEGLTICVRFSNVVTGEGVSVEAKVDSSNKFILDVPIERSTALVHLTVNSKSNDYGRYVIGLNQDRPLQLVLTFKDSSEVELSGKGGLGLTKDDMPNIIIATDRFLETPTWDDYSMMTPEVYFEKTRHGELSKRMGLALDSLLFSKQIREFLKDDCTLAFLKGRVLVYKIMAEEDHAGQETKIYYADFSVPEPNLNMYSFLKEYDLNNPKYLYTFFYQDFLHRFLSISAFKIPIIGDTDVEKWLSIVRNSIKGVVGFESGLFYDMLVAKAYSMQLTEQHIPLSKNQIEYINKYYRGKNETFIQIIMKLNDDIIRLVEHNNDLHICEIPSVGKEVLLDSILSRYRGHVVLVDFWATWCEPCMRGHKSMKSIKDELKDKGVKFVYFTTVSSPKDLWNGKIKGIGGEQYYLSNECWEYLLNTFGFEGIPSYLIIDKEGNVKHKFTGFPGMDKMKEMLEELN